MIVNVGIFNINFKSVFFGGFLVGGYMLVVLVYFVCDEGVDIKFYFMIVFVIDMCYCSFKI